MGLFTYILIKFSKRDLNSSTDAFVLPVWLIMCVDFFWIAPVSSFALSENKFAMVSIAANILPARAVIASSQNFFRFGLRPEDTERSLLFYCCRWCNDFDVSVILNKINRRLQSHVQHFLFDKFQIFSWLFVHHYSRRFFYCWSFQPSPHFLFVTKVFQWSSTA